MKIITYVRKKWVALPEIHELVSNNITKMWLIEKLKGVDYFFLSRMKMYEYTDKVIEIIEKYKNEEV